MSDLRTAPAKLQYRRDREQLTRIYYIMLDPVCHGSEIQG